MFGKKLAKKDPETGAIVVENLESLPSFYCGKKTIPIVYNQRFGGVDF